eukprot:Gb_04347 [translate_table: standard]
MFLGGEKAEIDHINYEIQKKKEQEEREAKQECQKKINVDLEAAKIVGSTSVSSKTSSEKVSFHSNLDQGVAEEKRLLVQLLFPQRLLQKRLHFILI